MTVHRCLRHQAPTYLTDYCVPVSDVAGRQHLQSASCHQLTVPHVRCSTCGCHSFASAGPTVLNSLPDNHAQFSCWTRPVSTEPENTPVCLLLVFRWQCVRECFFTYSCYTIIHFLLTYVLLEVKVSPWLPQCAEGICWGVSGTMLLRCKAWHSWGTCNIQDHRLVWRTVNRHGWNPLCCVAVISPDLQS